MSTHVYTVLQSSTAVVAGGTVTSSSVDLTGSYGGDVTAQITNGASAPWTPCVATIQVSGDNTNFYPMAAGTEDITASATTTFFWDVPPGVMFARVQFTGNTGQSVTVAAQIMILATI